MRLTTFRRPQAPRLLIALSAMTAVAAVMTAGPLTAPAQAPARTTEQIAASIPTEVPEVHTGGSWQDGGTQGVYRTITVLAAKENTAQVFIQWISLKADNPIPEVAKMVAIKEVTDKKLPNAFVTLEADKEGEAIIVVASFDPNTNKDVAIAFKASKPGVYAATALPEHAGSGTGAPAAGAPPVAAPPAKK